MKLPKKVAGCLVLALMCVIFAGCTTSSQPIGQPEAKDSDTELASSESARMVSPTYELAELIERFEKDYMTGEQKASLAVARTEWLNLKKSGYTRWGSENWMKDPDYYKSLNTSELVEECFSRAIFKNETSIYNEPFFGLESLRIFHNGFAELFRREDLWKGILHLYEHLSSKLTREADLMQIVTVSGHFDELRKLYILSPLKEQVKGRERIFLAANLRVLKRFQWYLGNYDPERLGTGGSPGFFREPCSVARVALMLAKQVEPRRYLQIEPAITRVRWTKEQNPADLRSFINLVVTSLNGFVSEEDIKNFHYHAKGFKPSS